MILAGSRGDIVHLALLEAGILADYALWRPDAAEAVGDVYSGRVMARVPALGGTFVDLGGSTGFLPDSAGGKVLSEGEAVAVRIARAPQGGKGPRLAVVDAEPAAKPGLIARGPGPLAEFRAHRPDDPILADDFALIARLRPICDRVEHRAGCLAPVEEEIAALAEPEFVLPHGARGTVTPTPALTAIDIDAGSATAGREGKNHAQARLNRAILPEIARQIRLRNLGGAILVDFAGMKASARRGLAPEFAAALSRDPLAPRLLGFTALGFAEILRPRIRPPLHESLR